MQSFAAQVESIVDLALAEDLGWGDVTTEAVIPPELEGKGCIRVKAGGVLAGVEMAARVFCKVDPQLQVEVIVADGARVEAGQVVSVIEGRVASILKGERTALNFLQRLSGIASETARYVEAIAGLPVTVTDTRKTAPGLRPLEKYAVRMGGGQNHRQHLGDGVLIKDNHLAALSRQGMTLAQAIQRARAKIARPLKIEVEVETLEQALEAAQAGADILLLDNMGLEDMCQVVEGVGGRALTEASGNVNLESIRAVAET
ncbi:MAG: carboxylating nicotinate-nucleotide diphosphorylase, partial [Dehalococcoidia bacterium]